MTWIWMDLDGGFLGDRMDIIPCPIHMIFSECIEYLHTHIIYIIYNILLLYIYSIYIEYIYIVYIYINININMKMHSSYMKIWKNTALEALL